MRGVFPLKQARTSNGRNVNEKISERQTKRKRNSCINASLMCREPEGRLLCLCLCLGSKVYVLQCTCNCSSMLITQGNLFLMKGQHFDWVLRLGWTFVVLLTIQKSKLFEFVCSFISINFKMLNWPRINLQDAETFEIWDKTFLIFLSFFKIPGGNEISNVCKLIHIKWKPWSIDIVK